jgi:4-hydroxybenzoate polyprenyltransferase
VQALIAFGVLLTFPPLAIALGVGSLALVAVYPFAKRFTWWPQVFLGLAFNWGALLAYAAHDNQIGWPAGVLWLAGIVWTLFYDTIYAHQDKEDDALIGVKSTARLFGTATRAWLRGFMLLSVLLLMVAVLGALLAADAGWGAVLVALAGVWGFGAHLGWQLAQLDIDNPDTCMKLFRTNRDAGLIVALFLAGAALL